MKKKTILCVVLIGVLFCSFLLAGCVRPTEYMVPMRDGIRLSTDVSVKRNAAPHGSILIRTPYDKSGMLVLGMNWALKGWPTVIQNTRGRYSSEGNDTVFRDDYKDGPDTLAWIADQPWSNGKIATFGGSALGITQYLAAGANPPNLSCQYIQIASPNLYQHGIYHGGQFRKNLVEGWLKGQGSLHLLNELWANENSSLDYWTNVSLEQKWGDVNVPAIHLGGWYDCFSQGTIDGFMGYNYLGGADAQGKSKLIMGPWTHGAFFSTKQGQLNYPSNAIDTFSMNLFWQMVNAYTMGASTEYDSWPAVTYYVMGDVDDADAPGNVWRYADAWPLEYTQQAWYLQPNGSLLPSLPIEADTLTYTYDPSDPVPTIGGGNLMMAAGPYDQTPVENRSDVLVFTSPILQEPYEATGPIIARLYVSSDCPDTDFTVKLTDVYPDGRSMLITDGILRMRNRNGTDHWEFMQPGMVYEVDVDLWSTSYIWNAGHRIRVTVSSSNYPRFLNNPNTVDAMCQNTTFQIAQNTLFIDSSYPSCVLLPEIPLSLSQTFSPFTPPPVSSLPQYETHQVPTGLRRLQERYAALADVLEYRMFMIP